MPEDLEERSKKGRRITLDLTLRANRAIEGLRRLARQTTPDFFYYCFEIGKRVISAYQSGGTAYIEDKNGQRKPLPPPKPSPPDDYLNSLPNQE